MKPKVLEFRQNPPRTVQMERTQNTIDAALERTSDKPPWDLEIITLQMNVKIRKEN